MIHDAFRNIEKLVSSYLILSIQLGLRSYLTGVPTFWSQCLYTYTRCNLRPGRRASPEARNGDPGKTIVKSEVDKTLTEMVKNQGISTLVEKDISQPWRQYPNYEHNISVIALPVYLLQLWWTPLIWVSPPSTSRFLPPPSGPLGPFLRTRAYTSCTG